MSNPDGDMKVVQQPEGTLLTAAEEALAAELEGTMPNQVSEGA
ncbi:hypothetical protein GCM10027174_45200 [Salinifilum aidingensis]